MKRTATTVAVIALLAFGCGTDSPAEEPDEPTAPPEAEEVPEPEPEPEPEGVDLASLEEMLDIYLGDDDLGLYVTGIEQGGGNRVRVLTQLDESQTEEADALCNTTTAAAYGLDGAAVSGVDVAAAGGRNIAHCRPKL